MSEWQLEPLSGVISDVVPRYWVSESRVRMEMLSRRRIGSVHIESMLAAAEALDLIEFRSAALSLPDEPGDHELPILTIDREQIRQVRRLFLTNAEKASQKPKWKPPKPMTLEAALKERRRSLGMQFRTPPPPPPDPIKTALVDAQTELSKLRDREQEQAALIADLLERVNELEHTPRRRRRN